MADELLADYDEGADEGAKENVNGQSALATKKSGSFQDLGLREELQQAVQRFGFEAPSEVQLEVIPHAIHGHDILCQAKAGMGKTAVFIMSILQQLDLDALDSSVQTVTLVHTRELAHQVGKEFKRFAAAVSEKISVGVCHPEIPLPQQKEALKSTPPHILVGTPSRITTLCRQKVLDLSKVRYFVLDEADLLLSNIEMRSAVQDVFLLTPVEKQVYLTTATLPAIVRSVAKKFTRKPVELLVDRETGLTLHGLQQYYTVVEDKDKLKKLEDILDAQEFNQVVIFTRRPERCRDLQRKLEKMKFPSLGLDEKMNNRVDNFEKFQASQKPILVCTDVFARGLDVQKCNVVIQYDMAPDAATYLHRVGRSGRFGTKGLCISFIGNKAEADVLKQVNARFEIPVSKYTAAVPSSVYMTS